MFPSRRGRGGPLVVQQQTPLASDQPTPGFSTVRFHSLAMKLFVELLPKMLTYKNDCVSFRPGLGSRPLDTMMARHSVQRTSDFDAPYFKVLHM